MANWTDLKAAVAAVIKTNGTNAITGEVLQSTLNTIISNLGENATFKGIATQTTAPGTPDGNLFYLASTPGVYANFSGILLHNGEIAILIWSNGWTKQRLWDNNNILTIAGNYISTGDGSLVQAQSGDYTYPFKASDFITLANDKFIISNILTRTDLAYMAVYDKNKVFLHAYVYTTGMNTSNVVVITSDILATYPKARYIRFCSDDTTAIVNSYLNSAMLFNTEIKNIEESILEITDGKFTIQNATYDTFVKENGYIALSSGTKPNTTDTGWQGNAGFIGVTPGTIVTYRLNAPTNVAAIAAYGTNKNYLQNRTIAGNGIINGTYVVPSDVAFIRVTSAGGTDQINVILLFDNPIIIDGTNSIKTAYNILGIHSNRIEVLENEIVEIKDIICLKHTSNIFGESFITVNYGYQNTTGSIVNLQNGDPDTSWFNTSFIEVKQGTQLIAENLGGQGSAVMTIGFFDKNKICLTGISIIESISESRTFEIDDERIKYVRFSGNYSYISNNSAKVAMYVIDTTTNIGEVIVSNKTRIEVLEKEIISKPVGYSYDINHFIHYGQSLSQGDWDNSIVSYHQKYNSLMFTGTMRVWEYRDQANKYAALVPAVENVFQYQEGETVVGATSRGETPCVGTGEKFMEEIEASGFNFNQYQFQLLLSAPGMGGTSIESLGDRNGAYYQRLLADVTNGKRLSNALGKTYACHAVSWIQGEANCSGGTSFESYYNQMENMFNNLNTDIKAITGQTEDVHFFLYQTWCFDWYYAGFHYPFVPLAQLKISLDKSNVHMVSPIYHLPQLGDYTHFNSEGSKWFGGYCGLAYKKVMIDNQNWQPIHMTDYSVVGNTIYLKFYAQNYPLVFDTINVVNRGVSKGFQIRNPTDFNQNSFLDIITNVEIVRPDTIKITCSSSPAGKKLTYAINGTGNTNMSSGNLRDSATEVFNFPLTDGGDDVEHKLYNWCPLFEQIL